MADHGAEVARLPVVISREGRGTAAMKAIAAWRAAAAATPACPPACWAVSAAKAGAAAQSAAPMCRFIGFRSCRPAIASWKAATV